MNILTEKLPTTIRVGGREHAINTDYRAGILTMMAFEDPELTIAEKYSVLIKNIYKDPPEDTEQAIHAAVAFLDCYEERAESAQESTGGRVYSFTQDARYIYTAMRQSHGVDLETIDYMHWFKFCYLFQDLSEVCLFSRLLDLRIRRRAGTLTKEESEYCVKIADILDLPEDKDTESRAAADTFMDLLEGRA